MEELVSKLLASDLLIVSGVMLGTMILKDIVTNIASGLMFKLDKNFNAGDEVLLDGETARIISIGTRQTVFDVDGQWLYVHNERIKYLKLGKKK